MATLNRRVLVCGLALWVAPVCLAGDDAVDRERISALLDSMEQAVLAADVEGYMKHVADEDRHFVREQRYWANDLPKNTPASFDLVLGEGELRVSGDRAVGPVVMTWAMRKPSGEPRRPRELAFDAAFVRRGESWRWAGEEWLVHEGEGVRVLYDEGLDEVAKTVAEAFPEVRSTVEELFALKVPPPQQIKLYATMKHLQGSITLSYTDGLSGWNEPGESVKILIGRRSTAESLRPLLAHEFGHVCTFEMGEASNLMPWWVLEGVAEFSSAAMRADTDGPIPRSRRAIQTVAKSGGLAAWDELTTFGEVKPQRQALVYSQGHDMIQFISEQFGRKGLVAWLSAMANGISLDDATRRVMSMSFAELDAKWREAVAPPPEPESDATAGGTPGPKPRTTRPFRKPS